MSDRRSTTSAENGKLGGRPKGSCIKPKLSDDLTDDEKKAILVKSLEVAFKGDTKMLQFFLEQIYGKAPQSLEADVQGNLLLTIAKEVADKYDTPQNTSNSR